jgi:hypothetical protein
MVGLTYAYKPKSNQYKERDKNLCLWCARIIIATPDGAIDSGKLRMEGR